MKTKAVTFLVHFTAWIIFLSLPYIFRPKPMGIPGIVMPDEQVMFLRFFTFNSFLIIIFYLHGYWMMPRLLLKKHWFVYACMLVLLLLAFIILRDMLFVRKPPMGMGFPMGPEPKSEFELFKPQRGNSIFLFIVIIIISAGVRIVQEWMRAEKKQSRSKRNGWQWSFRFSGRRSILISF